VPQHDDPGDPCDEELQPDRIRGGRIGDGAAHGLEDTTCEQCAQEEQRRRHSEPGAPPYCPDPLGAETARRLLSPNQRYCPAPDFIAEVLSESTEANDRGVKRVDYAAHRITEYWIVDPDAETVEVNVLGVDEYPPVPRLSSGMLVSVAIPNFTIPLRAIFDDAECDAAIAAMYAQAQKTEG
jgi:hypothetical protein